MTDRLSAMFAALAHPTRRAILGRLARGETAVTELAAPFAMSLPAVSKHLKVLERAGLIARGRNAQWRPCRLQPAPLDQVAEWVEHYRRSGEQSPNRPENGPHAPPQPNGGKTGARPGGKIGDKAAEKPGRKR
jgi:DNA-binding transcriptional ArsR family regulator